MARKQARAPDADRLEELLQAGDHRTARAEARARLRSSGDARAEAVLASLAPDRGAVAAGAVAVAAAIAIAAWTILVG